MKVKIKTLEAIIKEFDDGSSIPRVGGFSFSGSLNKTLPKDRIIEVYQKRPGHYGWKVVGGEYMITEGMIDKSSKKKYIPLVVGTVGIGLGIYLWRKK